MNMDLPESNHKGRRKSRSVSQAEISLSPDNHHNNNINHGIASLEQATPLASRNIKLPKHNKSNLLQAQLNTRNESSSEGLRMRPIDYLTPMRIKREKIDSVH